MQALDLVHPDAKSGDYAFKHALVRDALYQSLLTGPRAALHLKIAEEIERRSGNRLPEVVETLAHHYGQTDRADKAFTYLAMAGAKSLGVYSLDEAERHFAAAIALFDEPRTAQAIRQIAELLADLTLCSNLSMRMTLLTETSRASCRGLLDLGDSTGASSCLSSLCGALLRVGPVRRGETRANRPDLDGSRLGIRGRWRMTLSNAMFVSASLRRLRLIHSSSSSRVLTAASATDDPYIQVFRSIRRWHGTRFIAVAWLKL